MSRPQSDSPPIRIASGSTSANTSTTSTSKKRRKTESRRATADTPTGYGEEKRGEGSRPSPAIVYRAEEHSEDELEQWEGREYRPKRARSASSREREGPEGWTYHLEVIQQPQRARACGFGNKDRRPLSPPPIIRLWVRTASGAVVDPNLVNIQFLVLHVDLWSIDRQQERNVVMHPVSAGVSRLDSPPLSHAETPLAGPSSRPGTGGSRPPTGSSGGASSWSGSTYRQGGMSSHHCETSYTKPQLEHDPDPPRPKTAPSQAETSPTSPKPTTGPNAKPYTLPPLASIAEDRPSTASGLTLPALHARQQLRPGSSSGGVYRPRTGQSGFEGSQSGDYGYGGRPISSSSSMYSSAEYGARDRPSSSWSNRPSTSGEDLRSPRSSTQFEYSVRMADPLYPPTPGTGPPAMSFAPPDPYSSSSSAYEYEKTRYISSQPAAQYSRVLVGKSVAVCHKLQDEDDKAGLYFFTADLGIRTEGTFVLRMVMMDLVLILTQCSGSMMTANVSIGASAPILAQCYSDPFTVYSAKRFPGVIPTTNMTKVFASQGVKLSVRETKKTGGGGGGDDDGDEEDD
ncbi:hypothetical protein I316_07872 [Kwoniella heveanensis BCC8398]|uniref:Velvet domain-containing protein n=1 Tax=Kwoniella heveanensis BCC8398 TaxID=1296120 RepID=A0A1B9GHG9_9TREE|nr:hypothetical protein I316_07872 [Kwoniella heveanensis BCC8398]